MASQRRRIEKEAASADHLDDRTAASGRERVVAPKQQAKPPDRRRQKQEEEAAKPEVDHLLGAKSSFVVGPTAGALLRFDWSKVLDDDRFPVERHMAIGKPLGGDEFSPGLEPDPLESPRSRDNRRG